MSTVIVEQKDKSELFKQGNLVILGGHLIVLISAFPAKLDDECFEGIFLKDLQDATTEDSSLVYTSAWSLGRYGDDWLIANITGKFHGRVILEQ